MTTSKPEVVQNFENASLELFAFMDKCTETFNEYEIEETRDFNVTKLLQGMRQLNKSTLDSLHSVQASIETLDARMKGFAKRIDQFENHISRMALNHGLDLIPDEMLFEIFSFAAESLKEKVDLSLVCRRFRRVMMSARKMWDEHYLEIGQTPEQMIAIAEGNRFVSLKAIIRERNKLIRGASYEDWARKRGLDPERFIDRFKRRSLSFILPLHLEELQIWKLHIYEDETRRILDSVAMQSVRTLVMRYCSQSILSSFERRHTPLLQNLAVDFVPRLSVAKNLIRCKLAYIEQDEMDSLKEFLASANSLQYLFLHIWKGRFYEACDLPSLRTLESNFTHHPSFAKHLTRFTLSLQYVGLRELLDFLSSTEVLQALTILSDVGDVERDITDAFTVNSLQVVTLPYLVFCEIHQGHFHVKKPLLLPVLTTKLRMPVLRRLELLFNSDTVGFGEDGFENGVPIDNRIVSHERFKRFDKCDELIVSDGRFIRIRCDRVTSSFIDTVAGYLTDIGGVQIEIVGCEGWEDGMYRRDEMNSSWIPERCIHEEEL